MELSSLETKQLVILPAKRVYLGVAEGLQFETCKLWQTIGKSGEERRGTCFDKRRKLEGVVLNESSFEEREFRTVVTSHWLELVVSLRLGCFSS